jgi:centractin
MDTYIGKELEESKRGLYKLRYPMRHGVIENWDDMELIWKHVYSLLKVSPNECPVLLTEAIANPTRHKKKMLEIFFEKFQVPAAYVATQGILSLYLLNDIDLQVEKIRE